MLGLAGILLLGIGAQWLAWRLRIPSILLLLLAGFTVGPFTGQALLDPDALLGDALQPFVSLAVAVVLFEGGLTLRFRELRGAGKAVTLLVTVGPLLTFAFATVAARYVLSFPWELAALIGSILVVTGPTVIGPLLRHVRPSGPVGRVVRWEGIVTDPIGAILAVLVFEAFLHGEHGGGAAVTGLLKAIFAGGGFGALAGLGVIVLLRKRWIPDFLHAPVTLAVALLAFVAADRVLEESGLLAVTLMGILLANQRRVVVEHIVEFEENLRVILVSTLFILLAARLPLDEFTRIDLPSVGFAVLLIVLIRPAMVFLSTIGSGLSFNEKAFISWMAPRGIVAAAVASVFALEIDASRYPEVERLVPVIFLVILSTVAVYGLTAAPVARALGLSRGAPQGVLFVGAHSWARMMARALEDEGIETLLVDTNFREVQAARIDGLRASYGNAVADDFEHKAPLEGLGHVVAVTYNDEANALACLHFAASFGRHHVHQLAPEDDSGMDDAAAHLRGEILFDEESSFWDFESRFRRGGQVKCARVSEEWNMDDFRAIHETDDAPVVPLFRVSAEGELSIARAGEEFEPESGDTVIALVGGGAAAPSASAEA